MRNELKILGSTPRLGVDGFVMVFEESSHLEPWEATRRAKQDAGGHDIHGKFGGSLSFRPNFVVMSEAVKCYISEAWPTDRWVPDACARTCNLVRVQGST